MIVGIVVNGTLRWRVSGIADLRLARSIIWGWSEKGGEWGGVTGAIEAIIVSILGGISAEHIW